MLQPIRRHTLHGVSSGSSRKSLQGASSLHGPYSSSTSLLCSFDSSSCPFLESSSCDDDDDDESLIESSKSSFFSRASSILFAKVKCSQHANHILHVRACVYTHRLTYHIYINEEEQMKKNIVPCGSGGFPNPNSFS
ncbi:hypothetical protein DM860_009740 [Cuscuta australis]|uniref:Uncharacterized protein n=1 Tax=Cuscuta australis TaxID=267555 RepID=A0A328DEK7_9ASTE|nr:hypothetical protein DM860_009740 [Cuscuta australis]